MKIALFDLDGTMVDFEAAMREGLEDMQGPSESDIADLWAAKDEMLHIRNRMWFIKNMPNFWRNLPLIENSYKLYEMAKYIGFRCDVLTKAPSSVVSAWSEKKQWCDENLPDNPVIHLSGDKSLVYGNVLVDDWPGYFEDWLKYRPRGTVIMPVWDYNKHIDHPRIVHFDMNNPDWERISAALEDQYNRDE